MVAKPVPKDLVKMMINPSRTPIRLPGTQQNSPETRSKRQDNPPFDQAHTAILGRTLIY
jgi:hypothetical protein